MIVCNKYLSYILYYKCISIKKNHAIWQVYFQVKTKKEWNIILFHQ